MAIPDAQRTQLVDTLLDSLMALKRSTTPQEDLEAIAEMLLDHAADLDEDERPYDVGDDASDEGDRANDMERASDNRQ